MIGGADTVSHKHQLRSAFDKGFITFKTPSSLTSFILAMTLYPHVQIKGQAEIDAVVGKKRLPSFSDRASLPYVNAIVKEILRWNPAVPLGMPHLRETFLK